MKLSISLIFLFFVFTASARKVYNVFKPGQEFHCWTCDFMKEHNLNRGDTVVISQGTYGHTVISNCFGITFQNEGQVVFNGGFNFEMPSSDNKLIGNGTPGIKYGILIKNTEYFAGRWYAWGNMEIAFVAVKKAQMGFQVKTEPDWDYKKQPTRISIHDLLIEDVEQEMLYIGSDNLGGSYITGDIRRVTGRRSGRDGIQVRNGNFVIEDNDLKDVGLNNEAGHQHGILIGGNSNGGTIRKNKVENAVGYGIFVNGFGNIFIECNEIINSGNSAVFTKNYEKYEDLQKTGYQKFYIRNNTLHSRNPRTIEMYYDGNNGLRGEAVISNNRVNNTVYSEMKKVEKTNNGKTVNTECIQKQTALVTSKKIIKKK
jgi:cell fate (sporulation/competence/biofilm development) regulator YmcA (YheA/YmcA/DUF963 family)